MASMAMLNNQSVNHHEIKHKNPGHWYRRRFVPPHLHLNGLSVVARDETHLWSGIGCHQQEFNLYSTVVAQLTILKYNFSSKNYFVPCSTVKGHNCKDHISCIYISWCHGPWEIRCLDHFSTMKS
jgi:hypothetical protein